MTIVPHIGGNTATSKKAPPRLVVAVFAAVALCMDGG
jgi:hypothetical protein